MQETLNISKSEIPLPRLYSLDENITRKQLQSPEYTPPIFDPLKIKALQKFIHKHDIKYCVFNKSSYHYKFLKIQSKPQIIYYIWNLDLLNQDILWIVWPRMITLYGKQVVSDLLNYAKNYDLVTVSGLADGVDSLCHLQSIENNIPTIAILGGGISYYLRNHKTLIDKIIWAGGLILSEFKIGFRPTNYSFPQRNRIIAGLSDCLFLPEASEKSGSLITVDFAIQMNKTIYSTPNDIYIHSSKGVNKYISEGKIQAIYDFKTFLNIHFTKKSWELTKEKSQTQNLTWKEKIIVEKLSSKDLNFDELLQESWLSSSDLSISLSLLEITGIISQKNIWVYFLKNNPLNN